MGSVVLPTTSLIGVDSNIFIYSVERHPQYFPALRPLWTAVSDGLTQVLISELALLESLVMPYRAKDQRLIADFEKFMLLPGIEIAPVTSAVMRDGAKLRAQLPRLRSPDAIHAATALGRRVTSFITNDLGFRAVQGLNVVIIDDVIGSAS